MGGVEVWVNQFLLGVSRLADTNQNACGGLIVIGVVVAAGIGITRQGKEAAQERRISCLDPDNASGEPDGNAGLGWRFEGIARFGIRGLSEAFRNCFNYKK